MITDNKIQQAFAKYNLELDDEQVKKEVAAIFLITSESLLRG